MPSPDLIVVEEVQCRSHPHETPAGASTVVNPVCNNIRHNRNVNPSEMEEKPTRREGNGDVDTWYLILSMRHRNSEGRPADKQRHTYILNW